MLGALAKTNRLKTLNIRSIGSKPFLGWEGRLVRPAECIALEVLRIYADGIPGGTWPRLEIIDLGALIDNWQDVIIPPSCLAFRLFIVHRVRDCWVSFHAGVIEVGHGNVGDAGMYSDYLDIFEPSWLDIPRHWVHAL